MRLLSPAVVRVPWTLVCALLLLLAAGGAAHAQDPVDAARIPVGHWQAVLDRLDAAATEAPAPEPVLQVDRTVVGSFQRGVFAATLTTTFEVLAPGHVRVPVLDAATSIRSVRLDGRVTSLLPQDGLYTVGIDAPGRHTVVVEFVSGREDDRFARALAFRLPPSGPTRLDVLVPESDLDAALTHGAITAVRELAGGTRITGHLDAAGTVALSWKRRLTHQAARTDVRAEARVHTLFTLHEALVRGVAVVDVAVLEGETDRLALRVPPGVEVVDVTGEAVLQWRTERGGPADAASGDDADAADPSDRLTVLLRYLVEDRATVQVHFQFPVDIDQGEAVALRMPLPVELPITGAVGVQGPAGLEVQTVEVEGAAALTLRDLPPDLTELTASPLLMGFSFEAEPTLRLALARTQEVELTSTVVDDIQASTVLIEDGTEITKLRLRLRNNTRQYLGATLPDGAVLTHAFIDGQAVRPAMASADQPEALLFPLRQSERLESGASATHVVRPGDTLSGIAALHLGSPTAWDRVLAENSDQLVSAWALEIGQVLRLPPRATGALQESSFVIELAYKRPGAALGPLGRRAVSLPGLDVDAVSITWHLYTPSALAPLAFDANLTQVSGLRYDPLQRLRYFLDDASWIRGAWAGSEYESILSQRKRIYLSDSNRRQAGQEVTSSFPYVGELTRFSRILPGQDTPRIVVTWVARDLLPLVRIAALVLAFGLVSWLLRAPRDRTRWLSLAAALALLVVVGHHVLGVNRRVLWGVDLALAVDLLRTHGGAAFAACRRRLASPAALLDLLGWRNLAAIAVLLFGLLFLGAFPMLLSTATFLVLLILRRML